MQESQQTILLLLFVNNNFRERNKVIARSRNATAYPSVWLSVTVTCAASATRKQRIFHESINGT